MDGLKYRRKKRGLTQAELANLMGVSDRTIRSWESGDCHPGKKMSRLAEELECTEVDLLTPPEGAAADA